jgi:hypothetical protein
MPYWITDIIVVISPEAIKAKEAKIFDNGTVTE